MKDRDVRYLDAKHMLPQVYLDLFIEEAQSDWLYVDLSRLSVDYLFQVLGVRKYVLLKGIEVLLE